MPDCQIRQPQALDKREILYRSMLKAGDIEAIRRNFPQYFTDRPAASESLGLEEVTRPDLAARMRGLYFQIL